MSNPIDSDLPDIVFASSLPNTPAGRVESLLFVCLGNICRSPMARWITLEKCRAMGLSNLTIDSCGTGAWHAGNPADPRSALCAANHGLDTSHTARQLRITDTTDFDLVLAMDRSNAINLLRTGVPEERVRLIRAFDASIAPAAGASAFDVPDPYYGGHDGFEMMYQMLERACGGMLRAIAAQRG